jgi:thiol-disulfide isomerase/thioredoxin
MKGMRFQSWRGAALSLVAALVIATRATALGDGSKAPEFKSPALDGGKVLSLAAYRGKVVYLDFWASWCPPCLTSLPLLEQLRKEFPADQFQILAVNVDQDVAKARKFIQKTGVGYPSATDPKGRLPEMYGIETMPTSFLIDRNGVIRYVHHGFRKGDVGPLREQIAKLVAARGK